MVAKRGNVTGKGEARRRSKKSEERRRNWFTKGRKGSGGEGT